MSNVVNTQEVELLLKIVNTLLDWSGVSEDTPDDFEIMSNPPGTIFVTLGDIKDASLTLTRLYNIAAVAKAGK